MDLVTERETAVVAWLDANPTASIERLYTAHPDERPAES